MGHGSQYRQEFAVDHSDHDRRVVYGYVTFGFIADHFGRRPTFAVYLVICAVLVFIYGNTRDATLLMILGPFVGFFGSGYFSAFGAFISELFPTRARGAGLGFTYNVGRMASAAAPMAVGFAATKFGVGAALTMTSIAFFTGIVLVFLVPVARDLHGLGLERRGGPQTSRQHECCRGFPAIRRKVSLTEHRGGTHPPQRNTRKGSSDGTCNTSLAGFDPANDYRGLKCTLW